jgi:phytoene desaturase
MEFPFLFLGAIPQDTHALYSLMNYAGLKLGTWYPQGGFGKVIEGMETVAENSGAIFHLNAEVNAIEVEDSEVNGLMVNGEKFICKAVISSADYHHVESKLLPVAYRNYNEKYWNSKTLTPSCLTRLQNRPISIRAKKNSKSV